MENTLDEQLIAAETREYGGFWARLGAMLIDGLVMLPITALGLVNDFKMKSMLVVIVCTIVYPIYKIAMEYQYGATLGKMVVKIKVVNLQFEKPSFSEILIRNIFFIINQVVFFLTLYLVYTAPGFADTTSFVEVNQFKQTHGSLLLQFTPSVIMIIDTIVLLVDSQKRSLHDRIGQTYVIKSAA